MRTLRVFMLLAGIGVALFVYLPAPTSRELQRAATVPDVQPPPSRFAPGARLSAFSPAIALPTAAAAGPTPDTKAQPIWQTTVAVAAPAPTLGVLPKTLSETDPGARYKLVLDIQQQLKRVGCYWGRIDGSWGLATKDAMKEFTDRVNATLPLDDPDYVQLTLIQSHIEKTCGACPAGQSLSASGRCVGPPITAQAKPTAEAATAQKEVLPWKATPAPGVAGGQPLFKPMPPMVVSTEPLPEHMAIGARDTASVDVQQSAPPIPPGLDPNVAAMKQPITVAPKTEGRTRPVQPGTPRYNLLLSLGGLY